MNSSVGLRASIAIVAVRTVNRLSRLTGRGSGTVAGGRVGLRLDPGLLRTLSKDRTIILVGSRDDPKT